MSYLTLQTVYNIDNKETIIHKGIIDYDTAFWNRWNNMCFIKLYEAIRAHLDLHTDGDDDDEHYDDDDETFFGSEVDKSIISIFVNRDEETPFTNCCILSSNQFSEWIDFTSKLFNVPITFSERVDSFTVHVDLNALDRLEDAFMLMPFIRYSYEGYSSPVLRIMFDMLENEHFKPLLTGDRFLDMFRLFQFASLKYSYYAKDQHAFVISEMISIEEFTEMLSKLNHEFIQCTFIKAEDRDYSCLSNLSFRLLDGSTYIFDENIKNNIGGKICWDLCSEDDDNTENVFSDALDGLIQAESMKDLSIHFENFLNYKHK